MDESDSLLNLHLGTHGHPILPLLVGLPNAQDLLSETGLPRLSSDSIITLGCLSGDEAARSARTFFDHHHVRDQTETWTQKVADWSDGWPMHVHNTLRAIAEQLVCHADRQIGKQDCSGEMDTNSAICNLDHIDEVAAHRRASGLRAEYDSSRLSGSLSNSVKLVANIIHRIERALGKDEIEMIIDEEYPRIAKDQPRLTELLPVSDIFNQMLRRGLLQLTPDIGEDSFDCPIPSLRNSCVVRAATRLHLRAYLGDLDKVQSEVDAGGDIIARDLCGRTAADVALEEGWTEAHTLLKEG